MRYVVGFVSCALAVAMTIAAPTSCSDSTGEVWRNAGVHQVRVVQLTVPDTIASDEVLPIQLFGDTEPSGQLSLSRIDAVRESMEIGLTVWAEVEVWIGPHPLPPFDVSIMVDYQAQPPFDAGEFRVVIQQPDGSQLVEGVLVEP